MENRIQETIDRILLNSSYNVKMTLTENLTKDLDEQRNVITKVGRVGSATLKQLAKFKNNRNILMDVEAMSKLLKLTDKEFETQLKNAIRKDLAKGVPVGTIGNNTRDIMKVKEIKEATNRAATLTKGEKLSKDAISEISRRVESDVTQLTREVSESSIKAAEKRAAKLAKDTGKTVADDVKNLGGTTSFLTKFRNITTWQGFKDSLKKWGLTVVLSAAALYALWAYFFPNKPAPEEAEKIEGVPPPKDGGNKKTSCPAVTNTGVVYEYEYPGDTIYVYGVKDAKYYAKNRKTGIEFKIHDCYPETVKKLNASKVKINSNTGVVNPAESNVVVTDDKINVAQKTSDEDTLVDNQGDASATIGL
jgi:hypothetical protein